MHDLIEARQQGVIVGGHQEDFSSCGHLLEQAREHDLTRLGIDVRRGLIGQEHVRSIGQGPGDRHALLLARA